MVNESYLAKIICSLHFNAAGSRAGHSRCAFYNRPLQLCSLSTNNEGKQSAIVTLGVVVVFKLGKPSDLRIVTSLHRVVLAKKIPGDEN